MIRFFTLILCFQIVLSAQAETACKQKIEKIKDQIDKAINTDELLDWHLSLLPECVNNLNVVYNISNLYYQQGEYYKADQYIKSYSAHLESDDLLFLHSLIQIQLQKYEIARKFLRIVLEKDAKHYLAQANLAWTYLLDGDQEKSKAILNEIDLKQLEDQTDSELMFIASLLYQAGLYQKSLDLLAYLGSAARSQENFYQLYVLNNYNLKKYKEISSLYEVKPEVFKTDLALLYYSAFSYYNLGEKEQGQKIFDLIQTISSKENNLLNQNLRLIGK